MNKRYNSLAVAVIGLGLWACGDSQEINNNYGECAYCENNGGNNNSSPDYPGNQDYNYPESEPEEDLTERVVGGTNVSYAPANDQAEVNFPGITVLLENEGFPIDRPSLARIFYFEGPDFRCFLAEHPDYTHAIECFGAVSYKDSDQENDRIRLSLTPAPLQVLYYDSSSRPAASYYNWLSENSVHEDCYTKERISSFALTGIYFMSLFNHFLSLGSVMDTLEEVVDRYSDQAIEQWPEDSVTDIKVFTPSRYGFPGTTSIWSIELRNRMPGDRCIGDENSGNSFGECDLPSCIGFDSSGNCEEPCFHTGTRCAIPCEEDDDCPQDDYNLRCLEVNNGQACLLPDCVDENSCLPSEACIDIRDYDFAPTESGAWPLAAVRSSNYMACYPVECIPY